MLGIRNILALTGDPPRVGDYPTGTGVWDVDSIGLIEILTRLNRGEDQAGSAIGHQASFTIACALDPTAHDSVTEWDRLERKLAAGAHLVMTQPLYDVAQVEAMLAEARRRFGPRGSPCRCCWASCRSSPRATRSSSTTRCPGSRSPTPPGPGCTRRARRARRPGSRWRTRSSRRSRPRRAGTYLMPSFGRYEQAAELVRRIRARHPAAVPPDRRRTTAPRPAPRLRIVHACA